LANKRLLQSKKISSSILRSEVAAISVGVVAGIPLLDLKYDEDSRAEVDMNIVCTGDGRFIEVQGTAERQPFTQAQLDDLLALAVKGINRLVDLQRATIDG
jgi:ribonuclease PH